MNMMNSSNTSPNPSDSNNQPKLVSEQDPPPQKKMAHKDNPNPYLRRYGSHVKSHFSQSRCEFFESSDEEEIPSINLENKNNVNSLDHIKDIKMEVTENTSENNIKRVSGLKPIDKIKGEFMTTPSPLGKSPSIDSGHSLENSPHKKDPEKELEMTEVPTLNINGEEASERGLQRKDSLEMELDEIDDQEADRKSALIIKSRRDSISEDSFDKEDSKDEKPEKEFVNKFFQNGKVVEEDCNEKNKTQ